MKYLYLVLLFCSFGLFGQSQGVTNAQTKLRPNQLRWSPTDATLDSVYIIRADTSTGEPGWYLVTLGGGGNADTTLAGDVVGGLNSTFVRKINGVTVENKTPQGREVLQYDGTQWTPDSIDLADLPQMNASRVLGRGSSSAGVVTQLTPSNGVKISGNYIESDLTAGTGINISGTTTLTVSNSAPDQTVTISGATGTYPNFTVTPTAPGGSSGQVQYNNAGSFGALDSFTVSANPDRLGIGVPTPTARLDIQGSGATSATNALRVRNSAGTQLLNISNLGNVSLGATSNLSSISPDLSFSLNSSNTSSRIFLHNSSTGATHLDGLMISQIGLESAIWNYEAARIYFGTGGIVRGVIDGSGNWGIGSLVSPLSGFHNSINTTASTPSMLLSGTGYSGGTATTTKPTLLIEPTGTTSTGWSTSGTKLGVNAESGFSGALLDLQVNGVSKAYIASTGDLYISSRLNATSWRTSLFYEFYQPTTITGSTSAYYFNSCTLAGTNTAQNFWSITTTINKTGTGNYSLINANVTETSVPSGINYLIKLDVGGVSKFNVTNGGQITSASDKINLSTSKTPSSASDTGTTGDICWDSNYIYVCVGTNQWKRTAISTW